jgi:hypothetical protein
MATPVHGMNGLCFRGQLREGDPTYLVARATSLLTDRPVHAWRDALRECPELAQRAAVERFCLADFNHLLPFCRVDSPWPFETQPEWVHRLTDDGYWSFGASWITSTPTHLFLDALPDLCTHVDHYELFAEDHDVSELTALDDGRMVVRRSSRLSPEWCRDNGFDQPMESAEAYVARSWKSPYMLGEDRLRIERVEKVLRETRASRYARDPLG